MANFRTLIRNDFFESNDINNKQSYINFIQYYLRTLYMITSHRKNQQPTSKQTTDSVLNFLVKGVKRVTEFQSLPLYRKLERPNLNSDKLKSIGDQLDLEQKARVNFTNRSLQDNYMFNIQANPFTQEFHNEDSPINAKKKNAYLIDFDELYTEPVKDESEAERGKGHHPAKVTNLIDQIRKYKDQKVELRGNMSKPLRELMAHAHKQSHDIQASIPAPMRMVTPKATAQIDYFNSKHKPKQSLRFENALEMEQIIQLKDKSYYLQTEYIGNIFKFATDPTRIANAGKAKLDTYYFCHNSMKDIIQKRKLLVYRDISRLSRHLILQIHPKEDKTSIMELSEVNPSLETPDVDGMLSISSGRMKPHEMQAVIMQDFKKTASGKEDENSTMTLRDKEIEYPQNTRNVVIQKEDEVLNGAGQASEFLKYSLEDNEKKYMGRLRQDMKVFKQTLDEQNKLRTVNIFDRGLTEGIEERREEQLYQMFYIKAADKDKDRLIRRNKIFKDRYEELKVNSLIKICKMQKEHDRAMKNQQPSTRSKSKTPQKSVGKRK